MRKILLVLIFVISLFAVNSMAAKWLAGSDSAIMAEEADTASTGNVRIVSVEEVDTTQVTDLLITRDDRSNYLYKVRITDEGDPVYTIAMIDEQPEFPGGQEVMYRWLSDHISYPAEASRAGIQGRVVVEFDINKTGEIDYVQVVQSAHPALDAEAVRLVKSMPRWKPGRNNNQPVIVTYTLPVSFKLQSETQSNTSTSNSSNALFPEKDLRDAAMFREYGQTSLAAGDNTTALKYFEESFRIVPTQSDLITLCDSIIGTNQILRQQVFDRFAEVVYNFIALHAGENIDEIYKSAAIISILRH